MANCKEYKVRVAFDFLPLERKVYEQTIFAQNSTSASAVIKNEYADKFNNVKILQVSKIKS